MVTVVFLGHRRVHYFKLEADKAEKLLYEFSWPICDLRVTKGRTINMKLNKALRLVIAFVMLAVVAVLLAVSAKADNAWTQRQKQAHEIAELARSIGLPETDPIIVRAQEIWQEEDASFQRDRDIIATVIYNEAWGGCSERHRELVAAVIMNRVKSDKFPDTVYDVVSQKGQYLAEYANGDKRYIPQGYALEVCRRIAEMALLGEIDCPDNVIYQAESVQGTGIYEICKTSYSTTYFCYG